MTGPSSHDSGSSAASVTWCPDWNGTDYAANTGHHRAQDAAFLATLPVRPTDRVLDVGCGAGDFTRTVADLVPEGEVVGCDPQPSMLAEAATRAGTNQRFARATAQHLATDLGETGGFDVVTSRATFHWIPATETPAAYRQVHDQLRPGGWFRLECGGAGNIPASLALMDEVSTRLGGPTCPWNFAPASWALDHLEQAGFDVRAGFVRLVAQRRTFDRDAVVGWLHSQVLMAYTATLTPDAARAFTDEVNARVDELRRWDGTFDQTWCRLDALVQRPA